MAASPNIGFIGFGEAGFHLARGLRSAGIENLCAYDIHARTPKLCQKIQERAQQTATPLLDSNEAVARASDIILCVVTASSAADAAARAAPFLESRHLYADLNSVSPAVKQAIDTTIRSSPARFVEVAVMAPLPPYDHKVPMLLGGAGAETFAEILKPYGLRMQVIGAEVGTAAATKMFRSIIVKGLEALICECVMGASRYNAEERVFASLGETFPGIDWRQLADYMTGRVVVHGERRGHEMEEVAETLRSLNIEPTMAEATARLMHWSARLGLKEHTGADGPKTYREFLQAVAEATPADVQA